MSSHFPIQWVVYLLKVTQETQSYFQIGHFLKSHRVKSVVFKGANERVLRQKLANILTLIKSSNTSSQLIIATDGPRDE